VTEAHRRPGDGVRLERVTKRYRRRGPLVLAGLDLALEPGALTVVVGANGSGKSTLVRVLLRLTRPTGGTVHGRSGPVGYVPEQLPATIRMSAAGYLVHLGRIRGLTAPSATARAAELLGHLHLLPGPDVPVSTLSKGNRQKVAIAQAFLVPVGLLVLDEPYSGLDRPSIEAVESLTAIARRQGATVVRTAHTADAAAGASAAYVIDAGALHPIAAPPAADPGAPSGPRPVTAALWLRAPTGASDHGWLASWSPAPPAATTEVHVVVDRDAVDRVLSEALARRYSVVEVRAVPEGEGR
jgi:ABC-type Mn2+/Zn2+ transport system ATPase subunit